MAKYSAKGCQVKHGTSANPTDVLAQVESVGFTQGDRELLDVTTHDSSTTKQYVDSGLRETSEVSINLLYDPADAGHEALRAAEANGTVYYITVILPDAGAAQWAAVGYVTGFNVPDRSPGDPLTATVTFKARSAETFTQ